MADIGEKRESEEIYQQGDIDEPPSINKDALAGFVPQTVKYFAQYFPESREFKAPMRQPYETVTLFADISGFTVTSVALSKYGPYGAWALSDCLNSYMTLMIIEVLKAGGDIIKFAGDAMIAMWPHPESRIVPPLPEIPNLELWQSSETYREKIITYLERTPEENEFVDDILKAQMTQDLDDAWKREKFEKLAEQRDQFPRLCHQVVQCCLQIQKNFEKFTTTYLDTEVLLQVKLGVGVGRVDMLHLGGIFNRLEFLVCGEGLQQAFYCEGDSVAEKTIVSNRVWENLQMNGAEPVGEQIGDNGNWDVSYVIQTTKAPTRTPELDSVTLSRVSDYVPKSVLPHLSIAKGDTWANELRECTILFLQLGFDLKNFDGDDNGETLEEVHNLIRIIQTAVYAYEGSLNKFLSDDKGSTLVAVFGLFPVSHADDKARAVLAALRLKNDLDKLDRQCWIGITSGTVFSGLCGHKSRQREFSVIGVYVNLAARLMAEAMKWKKKHEHFRGSPPHILVSESVKRAAQSEPRLGFKTLEGVESVKCKGFAERQRVYKPRFLQNHKARVREQIDSRRIEVVSHFEDDLRRVKNRIMNMRNSADAGGCVVLVEGGAGMGTEQFKRRLRAEINAGLGVTKWVFTNGVADQFHIYQKENFLRTPVFDQVFETVREQKGYQLGDRELLAKYKQYIEMRRPDLKDYVCLTAKPLHFPIFRDERLLMSLSEDEQTVAACDLLCLFLEMTAHDTPIVVQVFRAQHLKDWDWHLVRRLSCLIRNQIITSISLIISCTPVDNDCYTPLLPEPTFVPQYKHLKKKLIEPDLIVRPQVWALANTRDYIQQWITHKLGFRGESLDVCDLIVNSVHERCGGRPGFCELFLKSLHESDLFIKDLAKKQVNFSKGVEERLHEDSGTHFTIPDHIHCLTITHFDRINVQKQMILKVASVLCCGQGVGCLVFDREMLEEVHPIPHYVNMIDSDLESLVELGFIHEVPTQNSYGDDPPLLGGSPLYDYTEVMPDIEYLKIEEHHGSKYQRGRMKKFNETREFCFKNDVLYWWVQNQTKPTPRGSIFFDSRILSNSECRNPQLTYAIGVSNPQRKVIVVQTTKKLYELRARSNEEADSWYSLFSQALEKTVEEDDNFSQVRPRMQSNSMNGAGGPPETASVKRADSLRPMRKQHMKRLSIQSLKQYQEKYDCKVQFTEEMSRELGITEVLYEFFPAKATAENMMDEIFEKYCPNESVLNYHLRVSNSDWPLYGSSKLWDNNNLRIMFASIEPPESVTFKFVKSDEEKRYSRMPGNQNQVNEKPVVVKVKFPRNASNLTSFKQHINFNTSTIHEVIEKCLLKIQRSTTEHEFGLASTLIISNNPHDWMLRLVGTDFHLFGESLLAETPCVREAYDQNGTISFALLKIKTEARRLRDQGKQQMTIYRFYAFSYGFMRDIIYLQLLPKQREDVHKRCKKHLQFKIDGAERGSQLEILKHRHEAMEEKTHRI